MLKKTTASVAHGHTQSVGHFLLNTKLSLAAQMLACVSIPWACNSKFLFPACRHSSL